MKMIRKPTFAGKIQEKDERDIRFWAYEKTAEERVQEGMETTLCKFIM